MKEPFPWENEQESQKEIQSIADIKAMTPFEFINYLDSDKASFHQKSVAKLLKTQFFSDGGLSGGFLAKGINTFNFPHITTREQGEEILKIMQENNKKKNV